MKHSLVTIIALALMALGMNAKIKYPYQDASLPIDQRVEDLLSRMTVEEKAGQLVCLMGWDSYQINGKKVTTSDKFRFQVDSMHVGMYWAVFRADPWTQKTIANGLNPALAAEAANAMQRYAIEHTRLGIPIFLAEEAPHGHMAIGSTVFPTGLGMAATWNPDLIERVGEVIGKEIRVQGGHISYGPVLDLAREPRWSRVEETMGEDPYLSGTMGAAMVKGLGGGDLSLPYSTIATLKHFIAYGTTEGGQNGARSIVGPRELKQVFLPPFKRAIDAGALSVMTSYNSLDGVPCTSNKELLTDMLRNEWGFNRGFVVSDLFSIDGLKGTHHTAANWQDAAMQALQAGVDVDLGGDCFTELIDAVKSGRIKEAMLNQAVSRVLRLKFEMGLFERPYVDSKTAGRETNNDNAIAIARQVAQQSITLLKNDGILPLSKDTKVAVIGPNADNIYNMLGDYTAPQPDGKVVTVYQGIKALIGDAQCLYAKGCAIRDTMNCDIPAAIAVAKQADVVVAVVGGSSARDFKTSYEDTGAASAEQQSISDMECGEGFDRVTLDLLGHQMKLLEALKKTGKPLVVVYIEGHPLDKNWADENANALLTAYYPGEQGGNAITDVLFGDYNPAGRLPMSVPRHVGQLPVYYNKPAPAAHDYVEMTAKPLYPFGYGLSYTTFKYSDLTVTGLDATFQVTNTGDRKGDEVVQLYVHQDLASVVQPERQLKAFKRITLEPGETRTVTLHLDYDDFAIVDANMQWTVEPGTYHVLIGPSSKDIRLMGRITIPD
ncbi:MAG: glycoside hydrolase family 3 C-terminal domain-containing protein [Muribaculaceae bacterium]|nr:glycoside hydrolase family 3 C-terminal domain-containing protein [Muribaculaceae bacterium]